MDRCSICKICHIITVNNFIHGKVKNLNVCVFVCVCVCVCVFVCE